MKQTTDPWMKAEESALARRLIHDHAVGRDRLDSAALRTQLKCLTKADLLDMLCQVGQGRETMTNARVCTGYDGSTYVVGDRVELHPGSDLWMQGARYGDVIDTPTRDCVTVRLDVAPDRVIRAPEERFRAIPYR